MRNFFPLLRKKLSHQHQQKGQHQKKPRPKRHNLMRRISFGFLGVLGILLGTAFVLPLFVTINDYKPQVIAKAREALGRDVHIDGKLSLSLLPSPRISIEQARIGNLVDGSPQDLIRIKNLAVSVHLLPLLKKQIRIKAIDLHNPEIFLEKLPDGRVNWAFSSPTPSSMPSPSSPSPSPSFDIALDKVFIHNGHLVYHEKSNGKDTRKDIEIQEINISGALGSLQGPYTLSGTLKALGQEITVDTALAAPETTGGTQNATLTIQIGDATTSTLEGKVSLSPLMFKGALKASADPKAFSASQNPKGKASPFLSSPLRVDATVVANETGLSFTQATFEIGSAHPTGNLKVALKEALKIEGNLKGLPGQGQCAFSASPSPQGLTGSINATVTHAKEFLNWLNMETKTIPSELLKGFTLSGNYTLGDTIRLKKLIFTAKEAKLQGEASWQSQKDGPLVAIDLESPKIESVFKLLGVKDPKPLGTGKLKANIQWNATSLHLAHLKGQLGSNLSFAGDVIVDHTSVKPKVKAALSFNSINIDTLLASRQIGSSLYPEGKIFLISNRHPHSVSSSGSHWSHTPVDFSFLNTFDGRFEISASQLRLTDIVVSHSKLVATVQNGRLDINALTGSIFEGALIGNGYMTSDNTLRFHMALKEANLKDLPARGGNIKIVGGKLFFSSDLSTHGRSVHAMIQNLDGPVTITATNGMINGFDLHTISQRLGNLQNPASLLGLLNASMGKGQTPFSSFKGDIVFKNGVGTIQSMDLVAPDGQGQASGQIDLPRYLLNIQAEFRLTQHPKIPPFHMKLSGPLDNPSRKLDTSALQKYMVENVFKGAIKNLSNLKSKPAELLGSFLGGGKPATSSNDEQQQPDTSSVLDKPQQIVKDVFKGIF